MMNNRWIESHCEADWAASIELASWKIQQPMNILYYLSIIHHHKLFSLGNMFSWITKLKCWILVISITSPTAEPSRAHLPSRSKLRCSGSYLRSQTQSPHPQLEGNTNQLHVIYSSPYMTIYHPNITDLCFIKPKLNKELVFDFCQLVHSPAESENKVRGHVFNEHFIYF